MDISLSNAIIAETAQARDLSPEGGGVGAAAERVLRPILGGDRAARSPATSRSFWRRSAQSRRTKRSSSPTCS